MKALVVRLSSVGDVVHTLPVLVALRRASWEVGWLVEPPGAALLEGHPLVTHVARAPRASAFHVGAALRACRSIRGRGFDVALDFQGLWKSAVWARLSDAPRVIGYASAWRREPASSFLVGEQIALGEAAVHVIDKNLALLRALSIDAVGLREFPLPPTTDERRARIEGLLEEMELGPFALLNPGGGWESKLWPAESYGALARAVQERGLTPLVSWGPGEERLADRVVGASGGTARRCFPTTLLDFVELARRARIVVSADTGPLHLACAVGTPVVALFGPTDPARNGPFAEADVVVRRLPLCAPCYRRRCSTHEGVMKAIPPEEVVRALDRRLGLGGGGERRV